MPSSTARRRTASAPFRSFGGPQMPSPVRRIAPKPRRWTEISPPSEIFPARLAESSFLFILTSNTINSDFVSRCRSRCQPFNRQRAHSAGVEHFTFDHGPRNTYAIENVLGKPYAVPFAEHEINLSSLVGNKYQRIAGCRAQLGAEGMVVTVRMAAEVTIRIGDFTSKTRSLSRNHLSHEQINVSLPCQSTRLCQIGDQGLHLFERHIIQAIPVSELESAQSQSRDRAQYLNHAPSTQMHASYRGLPHCGWHGFAHSRFCC